MVTIRNPHPKLSDEVYKGLQRVLNALFNAKDAEGGDASGWFHDLLPKRQFADYYKQIKNPQALNPVQSNVKRRTYTSVADFVKDCTQIFHNARIYNRHGSPVYTCAEQLEGVLRDELKALATEGVVTEKDAELPDLGPLPPPSPSVSPKVQAEDEILRDEDEDEEEDDDDDDDEDVDADDSDDEDGGKKRRTRRRVSNGVSSARQSARKKSEPVKDEDAEEEGSKKPRDDPRRRRGRPPRVDTPMEQRIKSIIKALRKLRDDDDTPKMMAFEKLPERKEFPEYYTQIERPIALDQVRKNIKRRQYKTLEQFLADMDLMFDNAMAFNEDDSQIHQDAAELKAELRKAAEIERAKTDEELVGDDEQHYGKNRRIPLDHVVHKGETYRVGDWIHLVNPNDATKPTVAQIFRTWKDADGQVWINACWYYRPEQTVHWVEKRFYPDEVVKTGQYRDHHVDEILGKCFVMFFTRYSRGRPRGLDESKTPVYVCESRYNETEKHFNKIKTWKSCIPDEVRGEDYELDQFEKQRTLKKVPSPIAHLLPANAQEGDPLPNAKMGADNAPPVIGAVFKRARRETDSPPPEPTPPPPPPPAPRRISTPATHTPARAPANPDYHETMSMTQMYKQAHLAAQVAPPTPTPAPAPQIRQPHYPPPQTPLQRQPSAGIIPPHHLPPQPPQTPYYNNVHPAHQQAAIQAQQQMQQRQQYFAPAAPTTFHLPDQTIAQIPEHIRSQFLTDHNGRILWFSVPPVANEEKRAPVGHSAAYLARKKEIEERKRKYKEEKKEIEERRSKMKEEDVTALKSEAEKVLVKALDMWGGNTVQKDINGPTVQVDGDVEMTG